MNERPELVCVSERMIEKMKDQEACNDYLKTFGELKNQRRGRLSENEETLIRERVARLPREERLVTYLFFWEGASIQNISKSLEIPSDLVSKLLNNSLVRLRPDLQSILKQKINSDEQTNLGVAA